MLHSSSFAVVIFVARALKNECFFSDEGLPSRSEGGTKSLSMKAMGEKPTLCNLGAVS